MTLQGIVRGATSGSRLFDTDSVVTAETAKAFRADGYAGCLRYLSLGLGQNPGDLSTVEAAGILAAGLALMPVQHVQGGRWMPSENVGEVHGRNAADNARTIGLPAGVCLWLDLESVNQGAMSQEIALYCIAWVDEVIGGGFEPGLYVGPDVRLTGNQLYNLPFKHYWRSAARVPELPYRGYQMTQSVVSQKVHGIAIDDDLVMADLQGEIPIWLAPAQG